MSRMSLYSRMVWRDIHNRREEAMASKAKTPTQEAEEWIARTNEEMALAAERQAVEAILPYYEAQKAESAARSAKEAAGKVIKAYMEINGLAELDDPEHGLRAQLSSRSMGNERWDVRAMPDALILQLARAGCLTVDKAAMKLDANTALRMDAQPYYVP